MNASRSCTHCARPLPDGSPSSRRYCSAACRTAAYRARTTSTPPHPAVARVAELETQLVAAETRIGQLTAATRRKTDQVKHLAGLLAAERRSADKAIRDQAARTVAVRADKAALAGQLADLRRSWTHRPPATAVATAVATEADMAELDRLRVSVARLRQDNESLSAQLRELSAAAEVAATERRQLQGIVRQWDTLCRRLAKSVTGQTVTATDKRILATHARFRSAVSAAGRTTTKGGRP